MPKLIWNIDTEYNQSSIKVAAQVKMAYVDFEKDTVEIVTSKPLKIETLKNLVYEYEESKRAYTKDKLNKKKGR